MSFGHPDEIKELARAFRTISKYLRGEDVSDGALRKAASFIRWHEQNQDDEGAGSFEMLSLAAFMESSADHGKRGAEIRQRQRRDDPELAKADERIAARYEAYADELDRIAAQFFEDVDRAE